MTLDTRKKPDLTFFPENTEAEIIQNLYCIITTPKGSVPLYRGYGVDYSYMHAPITVARNLFAAAIVDAVSMYEPRAIIKSIDFDVTEADVGKLYPILEVTFVEQSGI